MANHPNRKQHHFRLNTEERDVLLRTLEWVLRHWGDKPPAGTLKRIRDKLANTEPDPGN